MKLALVNRSTKLSDKDLCVVAAAIEVQLNRDLAPAWGLDPHFCIGGIPATDDAPPDAFAAIYALDALDVKGALGYHAEQGKPFGRVGVGTILDNGGTVIRGPLSVSCVFSHEVIELVGDWDANDWCEGPSIALPSGAQGSLYARELCDPVESSTYDVTTLDGAVVAVSDFVLPAWFDPQSTAGPWSHLGAAPGAYKLAGGGYMIVRGPTSEEMIFADESAAKEQVVRQAARGRLLARRGA